MKGKENIAGKMAKIFIEHPLTFTLSVIILFIGYISLEFSPREANPQIVVSGGAVIIPYPGVKANEIQKVIITPLEKRLNEIEGVENIFGIAKDNVAILNIQFYLGVDKGQANLNLYNGVFRNIEALPKGIMRPIIKTMDIDTDMSVSSIAFYSTHDSVSLTDIHTSIKKIETKINRIDNVALTTLIGDKKEQFNIDVDLHKLNSYNLSLGQITQSIQSIMSRTPNIQTNTLDKQLIVFGIKDILNGVSDIENILIANYGGAPIYLKDIANIKKSFDIQNEKEAYITINDQQQGFLSTKPQITISISKKRGANVVNVNNKISELMNTMKPELEKNNIGFIFTKDDGYTANVSVNELVFHIIISIIIIGLLLIVALGIKEAFIVTVTIPMIIALTLFAGYMLGQTINKISLFSILLSLGLLVDSAIIVIENIHRHMHDEKTKHQSIKEIAINATNEVGNPTNVATIAIIITFLTMFLVEGTIGQYIRPIGIFAPIAMIASLIVAYIFTPYFVNKFLKKGEH